MAIVMKLDPKNDADGTPPLERPTIKYLILISVEEKASAKCSTNKVLLEASIQVYLTLLQTVGEDTFTFRFDHISIVFPGTESWLDGHMP